MKNQMMTGIAAIMLVAMMIGSTFVVAASAPGGYQPADEFTWGFGGHVVAGTETFEDDIIYSQGNITIPNGATLTLINTTLIMNMNVTWSNYIEVQNGGTLRVLDGGDAWTPMDANDTDASVIRANDTALPYNFYVRDGAHFDVDRSAVHNAGAVPVILDASLQGGSNPDDNFWVWRSLPNCSFRITINGVSADIFEVNPFGSVGWWGVNNMNDVTNYIQQKIRAVTQPGFDTATVTWNGTAFNITSGNADPFVSSSIEPLETSYRGIDISGATVRPAVLMGSSLSNEENSNGDWYTLTNGTFRISINGVARDIGPINFTTMPDSDWVHIENKITEALRTAGFADAYCKKFVDRFFISAGTGGLTSTVTVCSPHSGGIGTDISGTLANSPGGQRWLDMADVPTTTIFPPGYWMDSANNATKYSYAASDITKAGIYIRSNFVNIEDSLISENAYALLFDSCLPETLLNNNITDNTGTGLSIFNKHAPAYGINYELRDNIFAGNYRAIQFRGQTITVNAHNLNVSENQFGMEFYADTLLNADIRDNDVWLNEQPYGTGSGSEHGASTIYLLAGPTGTVNANIERNNILGNFRGGIWAGYQHGAEPSQNLNLLVANNTIKGNDGGEWYHASNILNVKIVDNDLGSSNVSGWGWSPGTRFRIGYAGDEGGSPGPMYAAPQVNNIEVARNNFLYHDFDDDVNVGGLFKVGGKDSIDMSFVDNDFAAIRQNNNYVYLGGMFRLGWVPTGDDTSIVCEDIDIDVSRNSFLFWNAKPNGAAMGQSIDIGGMSTLHAKNNINFIFNDNDVKALSETPQYIYGLSILRADRTHSEEYEPDMPHGCDNVNVQALRNTFDFRQTVASGYEISTGGLFRFAGEFTTVAEFKDNTINMAGNIKVGGLFQAGEIHNVLGKSRDTTVEITGNNMRYLYSDDNGYGPQDTGYLISAWDNVDVLFENNKQYTTYASGGFLGINAGSNAVMKGANLANHTTAVIRNNEYRGYIEDYDSSGIGGVIQASGNKSLDITIDSNLFDIHTDGASVGGFIQLGGNPGDWDPINLPSRKLLDNLNADITNNNVLISIDGDIGGVIKTSALDVLDLNVLDNIFTVLDNSDGSSFGHFIAAGWGEDNQGNHMYPEETNVRIDRNNINAYYQGSTDGNGIRVRGEEIIAEMNDNNIIGYSADVGSTDILGIRVGYMCENDGISANNVTVSMNNNRLENGARNAAVHVGAHNNIDFAFNGGTVLGTKECDSYTAENNYGHGIALEANNITAEITDTEFAYNRGAAVYLDAANNATVTIDNSNIHDNGWHGIYLHADAGRVTGSITDTVVKDNTADIYGNFADPDEYAGLYAENATLDLVRCIFDNPVSLYELQLMLETHVMALDTVFDDDKVLIDATNAVLVGGANPETTIANWQAISDGQFRLTVNGISYDFTGLVFTTVASMANVATIIQTALRTELPDAICAWDGTRFTITVPNYGPTLTLAPLANVAAPGTNISGLATSPTAGKYWLDCAANATLTPAIDSSTLLVRWTLDVLTIHMASGMPLPGCSVSVRNATNVVVGTGTTGLNGHWTGLIVSEYYREGTTWTQQYTPHTIGATKTPASASKTETIDRLKTVVLVLDYISPPPIANAGGNQIVGQDELVIFNGSASTDDMPPLVSFVWTFSNGTANITLIGELVNYTFSDVGDYNVTLTVTDIFGDTGVDNITVTVTDSYPPTADAGPDQNVNEDAVVTFDGSGSMDSAGITNYTWTFVDGTARTRYGVAPTYTFAQPGVYVVTLVVSDAAGNTATDTMTVYVADITEPVADAGADKTIPQGTTAVFDGRNSDDNVLITAYEWSFNDGTNNVVILAAVANHTFPKLGSYMVTLTVWDAAGNSGTDTLWVHVVDVTPPTVFVVAPGESLVGVPLNWSLVIVFSEPMNITSVEDAFAFSGSQAASFDWDVTGTYVHVTFAGGLAHNTTYTFTIGTNATDASGNPLTAAYTGTFRTMAAPATSTVVEPVEPETNFFTNNWWILVVIIVALIVLLVVSLLKGKKDPAPPMADAEQPVSPEEPAPEPAPEEAAAPEEPAPEALAEEEIQ